MQLHARQVAIAAGAEDDEIDVVVKQMIREGIIRIDRAEAILHDIRS
jgi:hydroxymethylglutaryl-CoA reductase